jgi:hypothetical protein
MVRHILKKYGYSPDKQEKAKGEMHIIETEKPR